jgi:hypothetical protein
VTLFIYLNFVFGLKAERDSERAEAKAAAEEEANNSNSTQIIVNATMVLLGGRAGGGGGGGSSSSSQEEYVATPDPLRQFRDIFILADLPLQILLGFNAMYFLANELRQLKIEGWNYFSSVWNYIDVITPSIILSVLCINAMQIEINPEVERCI